MKKLNPYDRRMVYVLLFIMIFIGNVMVETGFVLPEYTIGAADKEVFAYMESLEEGDVLWNRCRIIGMHWQDLRSLVYSVYRYLAYKRVKHFIVPQTAEAFYYIQVVCKDIWGDNFWEHPDYGEIFVISPIGGGLAQSRDLRGYWTSDNYGNEWEDMPMMDGFYSLHDCDVMLGTYSMPPVAWGYEFPEPEMICISVSNAQAWQGTYYTAGLVKGHAIGAKAGHAFEILAQVPIEDRIAKEAVVPGMMVAICVFIGAFVSNYEYHVKRKQEEETGSTWARPRAESE